MDCDCGCNKTLRHPKALLFHCDQCMNSSIHNWRVCELGFDLTRCGWTASKCPQFMKGYNYYAMERIGDGH